MAVARGGSGGALDTPPAIDYTLEFYPLVWSSTQSCSGRAHTRRPNVFLIFGGARSSLPRAPHNVYVRPETDSCAVDALKPGRTMMVSTAIPQSRHFRTDIKAATETQFCYIATFVTFGRCCAERRSVEYSDNLQANINRTPTNLDVPWPRGVCEYNTVVLGRVPPHVR